MVTPYKVKHSQESQLTSFQLNDDNVRVKTSPVIVLNALGKSGYRVTGASSAGTLSFVWTMERTRMKERSAGDYDSNSGEEEF